MPLVKLKFESNLGISRHKMKTPGLMKSTKCWKNDIKTYFDNYLRILLSFIYTI